MRKGIYLRGCCVFMLVLAYSSTLFATPYGFQKRFSVERNDEKVVSIRIKNPIERRRFQADALMNEIEEVLVNEQQKMEQKGYAYDAEVALFGDMLEEGNSDKNFQDIRENLHRSLDQIKHLNVREIFRDQKFRSFIQRFMVKFGRTFRLIDNDVMAHLDDATFFYARSMGDQVINQFIQLADTYFSEIIYVKIAVFVIRQITTWTNEWLVYNQNTLIYYLESFPPEELGMTREEVNHALSSIFESKIDWVNYFESQKAVKNWDSYGASHFYAWVRAANTRLRSMEREDMYASMNKINFAYKMGNIEGAQKVVSILDTAHMFSRTPAIAYDFEHPFRIAGFRLIAFVADLGIDFVPVVPSFIKGLFKNFIQSTYYSQKMNEGLLHGYFENAREDKVANRLRLQTINPLIML